MPLRYAIDKDVGIVVVTAEGSVSLQEDRDCLERVLRDPDFRSGFGFLVDNRARHPAATPDHVRGVAAAFDGLRRQLGGTRVAFVVDRDVSFGLARMFAGLTGDLPLEVEIFRDPDDARSWLVSDEPQG